MFWSKQLYIQQSQHDRPEKTFSISNFVGQHETVVEKNELDF